MKPFIIPIFIPHCGCPFNCIFCNQKKITGKNTNAISLNSIKEEIEKFLNFKKLKEETEIAFYGGTFLGLKEEEILRLLALAEEFIQKKQVDKIRFSTRPDSIKKEILGLLKNFSVQTIEIGAQSMSNEVLRASNRGHTKEDTILAGKLVKENGYKLGLQIMTGLPKDNFESLMKTANEIKNLKPNFVRIYPCIVFKDTKLATIYNDGKFKPQSLEEAIFSTKALYLFFKENNIEVIRMGLQAIDNIEKNILEGPYHPSFGHLVFSSIFLDKTRALLKNNKQDKIILEVHPKNISVMNGIKKSNIYTLKKEFNLKEVLIKENNDLSLDEIKLSF